MRRRRKKTLYEGSFALYRKGVSPQHQLTQFLAVEELEEGVVEGGDATVHDGVVGREFTLLNPAF